MATARPISYVEQFRSHGAIQWTVTATGFSNVFDVGHYNWMTVQVDGTPTGSNLTSVVVIEGTNLVAASGWAPTDGGPSGPWMTLTSPTGVPLRFGGAGVAGKGNGMTRIDEFPRYVRARASTVTTATGIHIGLVGYVH